MGVSSPAQDPLAAFRNPDGTVDRLKVGEAEQARQHGRSDPIPQDWLDALGWLYEQPGGRLFVVRCAHEFHEWFAREGAAKRGYTTLVSRTYRDGRWTTRVRRLPTFRRGHPVPRARRPRGAGRPRAARRTSSSSTTSSADPGSDSDSEPPTDPWRWASDRAWRSFVESVHSRDFEREIELERFQGVPR